MSIYPRGSEWRRWDLHVHSPLSILNTDFPQLPDGGGPDWDAYVSALERQPIDVYGITDYFTIDGYKVLREMQQRGRLTGKRLLPNIEFRLDKLINARGAAHASRRLNFHVVFSDEIAPDVIEDHFLHDLDFVYEQHPTDSSKRKRLKTGNLRELGEQLKSEDASFQASALQVGATTAVVALEQILDTLQANDRFKDKYLLLLPAENWDQIAWGSGDHLTRKMLLQASHIVMASNPRTVSWCLGQPPAYTDGPEHFIREFNALKPCVHGSDAHSVFFIGHPCTKRSDSDHVCERDSGECELRNCWIKADPTFEGLRQVLYEPRDRIRIQSADPTPTKSIYSLDRINIPRTEINSELTIDAVDLALNPGLVAVTGGKGSGKTALVDLIAHVFENRELTGDRNSFVRRIADSPTRLTYDITFAKGEQFSKAIGDNRFFDDSGIVYIAQGELEKHIDEHSDLNEYVHRLIFNSAPVRNTVNAFEYDSISEKVSSLAADIEARTNRISELEQASTDEVRNRIEKSGKQANAELEDLEKRIAAVESKLSAEKAEASVKQQAAVAALKADRDRLIKARTLANDTLRALDIDISKLAASIVSLNELLLALAIDQRLTAPVYPDRGVIEEVRGEVDKRLRGVVEQIEKQELEIKRAAEELREHGKLLSTRQELVVKRDVLRKEWKEIEATRALLLEEQQHRDGLFRELLRTVLAQREQYMKVIAAFGESKEPILGDLTFEAQMSVDSTAIREAMDSLVDKRQVEVDGDDRVPSRFHGLVTFLEGLATSADAAIIDAVADEIAALSKELRTKLRKAIQPQLLDQALYKSYLSVHPVVLYKRTALGRLSLGQKATVLMKIYLAEGDYPIIIDSHDDHLDNEYIMDELVGAIRHAKAYRQVIIASNNGNVVVNSDAEQLIIAQREDGVISYSSGSLEDPKIRARAVRVLEGGAAAFRKRQEKYRMM